MIDESKMLLVTDMLGSESVVGMLASEKLNGCRAYWDGRNFWTRGGRQVAVPNWFKRGLPSVPIDGEIHAGRGHGFGNNNSAFKVASNAVRLGGDWFNETDDGVPLRFTAFDFPGLQDTWLKRMAEARKAIKRSIHSAVRITRMTDIHHFSKYISRLYRLGAEGGIFRNPDVIGYECGRSLNCLRVKFSND